MKSTVSALAAVHIVMVVAGCGGTPSRTTPSAASPAAASPATGSPAAGSPRQGELHSAAPTGAACGGFEKLELASEASDLLNHRLRLRALAEGKKIARPHDLMGPEHPDEQETRIFLERDGRKLVIFAQELFVRAGKDLVGAAKKSDADLLNVQWSERTLPSGMNVAVAVHAKLEGTGEAIPVEHVFTRLPDDTMQVVRVFVNPPVVTAGAEGCATLVDRLISTLEPGPRRLDLKGGPRQLEKGFWITLPESYLVVTQEGPDFSVYEIKELRNVDAATSWLGFYFGGYPDLEAPQGARSIPGKILSRATTWNEWTDHGKVRREALVSDGSYLKIHVFLGAAEPKESTKLSAIAESLRRAR
ncbi:MAG TPA: hypothetical protein VF469_18300 [Kofleriaceae bacterium]